jgi:hypothetical protein
MRLACWLRRRRTSKLRWRQCDLAELMRLPSFRRFLLRQIQTAGIHQVGLGANDRSLEYREGQRTLCMVMLGEASEAIPTHRQNPEGALAATLIQILSEADQTARKEIARGGSRYDSDGSDSDDGEPV